MSDTTFVHVAGKKTQLTVGGSGPPLLYLHSASGESEWTTFHAALARHFTVYVPAHPGFALSEGLDEIHDIGDLVWHYVDLLGELKLRQIPVVGFSLGAWLAMELAVLRPELVRRMVLVDAVGVRVEGAPMGEIFIDDLEKMRKLLFFDPAGPAVAAAVPTSLDDSRILLWLRAREATARVGWNPYLHNPKLAGHLRRIACPTLILWGADDRLVPPAYGHFLAERIAGARLEIFDRCGHMLPFEQPEKFVERVTAFASA